MCGIAGIVGDRPSNLEDEIITMRDAAPYRGPDGADHGVFQEDGVALGHRRLKILDLTEAGSQSMFDESGALYIAHNGEVYNFLELREELLRRASNSLQCKKDLITLLCPPQVQ